MYLFDDNDLHSKCKKLIRNKEIMEKSNEK